MRADCVYKTYLTNTRTSQIVPQQLLQRFVEECVKEKVHESCGAKKVTDTLLLSRLGSPRSRRWCRRWLCFTNNQVSLLTVKEKIREAIVSKRVAIKTTKRARTAEGVATVS